MKYRIQALVLISFLIFTTNFSAQIKAPEGKKWTVIKNLSDEFNGKKLNKRKWIADPEGHPDFGWIGRSPALFKESSITLNKGKLEIEVGKLDKTFTSYKYSTPSVYNYYGGIIRASKSISYGHYFEAKFKMNKTEMGGGFWLMSKNICDFKHEIDITESVGSISPLAEEWGKKWDKIMHSNTIHRKTNCNEAIRSQAVVYPDVKNSDKYYTYGCWWKSPTELLFYLDGKHVYTVNPPVNFDQELFLHFSIEKYDWNPIPEDGGKVASASKDDRTTYIDYIRTYKLEDKN
ncbi:glycosyl hydrolase [Polaribacter sp. Q13]|uniref:glycosyl hydrolase n=1 Tax=Polaribacter sp. Q13 TaxID=2806551 RepID=UPI00193B8FF9|nr:glycosyl hydrolase [Polaribacter sp. Q13]QVY66060.1 glycosyl hydrolase [Polaribacter sp. Q13]